MGIPSCGRNKKSISFKLATWNVRTLKYNDGSRPQTRIALISEELKRYDVDIATLSETRLLGEGSLREERGGYTFSGEVILLAANISMVWDWQLRTVFYPASLKHLLE